MSPAELTVLGARRFKELSAQQKQASPLSIPGVGRDRGTVNLPVIIFVDYPVDMEIQIMITT